MSVSPIEDDQVVLVLGFALVRALEEQDAVGQRVAVLPAALGQRRPLVQAEERVGRLDLHLVEQIVGRLVLDDDGDVGHGVAKPARDGGERLGDVPLERLPGHRRRRGGLDRPRPRVDRATRTALRAPVFLPARRSVAAAPV